MFRSRVRVRLRISGEIISQLIPNVNKAFFEGSFATSLVAPVLSDSEVDGHPDFYVCLPAMIRLSDSSVQAAPYLIALLPSLIARCSCR